MDIKPIAIFRTQKKNPYEAARQATADLSEETGEIHFLPGENFEQALDGIEGFSHLWLIYQFHHNSSWKPKVLPPRGSQKKIGVFATRSPYRPNSLGLSCVQLVTREGLVLKVKGFDLLDETPIFDIKPYVAYADAFPEAAMGWLEKIEEEKFEIAITEPAASELQFLASQGLTELENFIHQQLSYEPFNSRKKRVVTLDDQNAILAYRTWRIRFSCENSKIQVLSLSSGYSELELQDPTDPYQDKKLHHDFLTHFQKTESR